MPRPGGRRAALLLVLALGAASTLGPAAAQESPETPPAKPPGTNADVASADSSRLTVSVLSADDTELLRTGDEYSILLRGDGHLSIETEPERVKPGANPALAERQRIDIRAEDSVIFVPARKDGLAPDPARLATSVRALYCEGHVAFVQETVRGKQGRRTRPGFRLEAKRLYVDLVAERVYAVDAVATFPGGTQRSSPLGVTAGASTNPTTQTPTFTLRAESLRLYGANQIVADKASFSVCDFGLPHEALESERIVITTTGEARMKLKALTAAAALGGAGSTWIAWRAERNLPFRAFREITRSAVKEREGSDAIARAEEDPRRVVFEGAELRVRPPFFGEEGFGLPFPLPIAWETDWLIPDVRIGHSSRYGYFGYAELKVPILRQDVVYERTHKDPNAPDEKLLEDGDRRVHQGLELDAIAAGAEYQKRGGAADPGFTYAYRDDRGDPVAKGELRGFYIHDEAGFDRNGTPIPREDRYWGRFVHQQQLNPGSLIASALGIAPVGSAAHDNPADGIQLDVEVSKQSDRDLLFEYFRSVAYTQKDQETYLYLRRAWDEVGGRFWAKWRLNDFQTQTENLPVARLDFLTYPLATNDTLGGLYLTAGFEGAHYRTRADDALGVDPDHRVARGDFDGRLDYKISLADMLIGTAYTEGRYTAWSESSQGPGAIDRVIGATGAKIGSQADAVFTVGDSPGLALRHVIVPEAGFEDRYDVSRLPEDLVPVDQVETLRQGEWIYLRLRNRLQYADDSSGKKAQDLVDLTVEARYFPRSERLVTGQDIWGTALGDARVYLGQYGTFRTECEVDPNRHRLLKLESTLTLLATRGFMAATEQGSGEKHVVYPDISFSLGYHDITDITRSVTASCDVRLTASWGFHADEIYDFLQHSFLRHRVVVTRRFHNWAIDVTGSYDPILRDTSFSFSVLPLLDDEERDPFIDGKYADLYYH